MGSSAAPRRSFARSITARTSGRPALTAENSSNDPRQAVAMIRASVVLPEPGGPWKIAEWGSPVSTVVRSADPSASRCSCPTSSSTERGRIRTGRGASSGGTLVLRPGG